MGNIVGLRGEVLIPLGEPVPELVAELERVLEMARAGEIKGAFIAVSHADECVSGARKGAIGYRLVGLLTKMIHDYFAAGD